MRFGLADEPFDPKFCDANRDAEEALLKPPRKRGTPNDDVYVGNDKRNVFNGLDGDDRIRGLGGKDELSGSDGNDVLNGGDGKDRLYGGSGKDRLAGGRGNDQLIGGPGEDVLDGGAGADTLGAGKGTDTLRGGPRSDIFAIRYKERADDPNPDIIEDFRLVEGDRIGVRELLAGETFDYIGELIELLPHGNDTRLLFDGDHRLTIKGSLPTVDYMGLNGFDAPEREGGLFDDDPYGFDNTSDTVADPDITSDGQYVAYVSKDFAGAGTGDVNPRKQNEDLATRDVFVRNVYTGAELLISANAQGRVLTNDDGSPKSAASPAISQDGRFIAFVLVSTDFSDSPRVIGDVVVRDLHDPSAALTVLTVDADGTAVGGAHVGFDFELTSPQTVSISADGSRVAFVTDAALLPRLDGNGEPDVYLAELTSARPLISLLSVDENGKAAGIAENLSQAVNFGGSLSMSDDGTIVAYASDRVPLEGLEDDKLFDVYIRNLETGTTLLASPNSPEHAAFPHLSADGRRLVFLTRAALEEDDTNQLQDAYVVDLNGSASSVSTPRRASVSEEGFESDRDIFSAVLSGDGRLAFLSSDSNTMNLFAGGATRLFVKDLETGAVTEHPATGAFDVTPGGDTIVTQIGNTLAVERRRADEAPDIADTADKAAFTVKGLKIGEVFLPSEIDSPDDKDWFSLINNGGDGVRRIELRGDASDGGSLGTSRLELHRGDPASLVAAAEGGGTEADPVLHTSANGDALLSVSSPSGDTGIYSLFISNNIFAGSNAAASVPLPSQGVSDSLAIGEVDWYEVELLQGVDYEFMLTPIKRSFNSLDGPQISIRQGDGVLAQTSNTTEDPIALQFTAPASGVYFAVVESAVTFGSGGYRLEASVVDDDPGGGLEVTTAASGFELIV